MQLSCFVHKLAEHFEFENPNGCMYVCVRVC